ncbi:MAG: hypothetical protein H7A23_03410 [Leptospiraceae bacterium]|nr:hypothetical protein [Leptospiraceae bacterium]MCP5493577.1 hypothetical protein [Leptospiraceae bacterium]
MKKYCILVTFLFLSACSTNNLTYEEKVDCVGELYIVDVDWNSAKKSSDDKTTLRLFQYLLYKACLKNGKVDD